RISYRPLCCRLNQWRQIECSPPSCCKGLNRLFASPKPRTVTPDISSCSQALLTRGEVLERMNYEFPELRASNVRFMKEQGMLTPARTAAGYWKYTEVDVDRLRFILALQRDHFLPLKVIKNYLDAIDAGKRPDSLPGGLRLEPRSVSQQLAQELTGHIRPMSRAELQGMSGASDELMRTLEAYRDRKSTRLNSSHVS